MSARHVSRRRLLGSAAAAAAGVGLSSVGARGEAAPSPGQAPSEPALTTETMMGVPFEARDVVRVGLVGCGRRGLSHLERPPRHREGRDQGGLRHRPGHAAQAQALFEKRKAATRPEDYSGGDLRYEELVKRDDLDLVYVRDALALARRDGGRGHGRGETRRGRSAGRRDHGRMLEARRGLRANPPPLRDARKLQLRLERDAGHCAWSGRASSASCSTPSARTTTTCATSCSRTRRRGCGGGPSTSAETATSIPPTDSGRSPGTWTFTAAIASTTSSR